MKNMELYNRAIHVIPGGAPGGLRREFHAIGPLVVVKAKGSHIYDADGKDYIDYHMAFGAILFGHNDDEIIEAVKQQLEKLVLHGAGVTDVEIEAAERLVKLIPSAEMVIFTPSGSEAVMAALRLARAYTGRELIVKFDGNYHGWHDYSLYNVSTPASKGVKPETLGIPSKVSSTVAVLPYNKPEEFKKFMEDGGCEKTAAVILEPVAHSMGVIPAEKDFIKTVEKYTKSCGALLIFDEVITGIRHNIHGMQYEMGVKPDLTILGKAIANGMPVAALTGRRDVMEYFTKGVVSSGTYQSHPLSMAAVVASLDKAVRIKVDREVARRGEEHAKLLKDLAEEAYVKVFVAGFRSTIALYFGLEKWPKTLEEVLEADGDAYRIFVEVLRREGILVTPNPRKRMHIAISHGAEELEKLKEAAFKAFKRVKEIKPNLSI